MVKFVDKYGLDYNLYCDVKTVPENNFAIYQETVYMKFTSLQYLGSSISNLSIIQVSTGSISSAVSATYQ